VTLGLALTRTGSCYPFFAPLLGWLGVALTGSDTSSNAMFGSLQRVTAEQLRLDPLLVCTANSTGGVMGKMIDAQSIVVSATATGTHRQEGAILRRVFPHSLALAVLMGLLVWLQSGPLAWMVPCVGRAADTAAEALPLWKDAAPGALGTAEHDVPAVTWWPAAEAAQPSAAMVICPGGGYGGLADHEGSGYARWLNSQGISAFVLRYRLGSKGYRHPVMLGDVSRAVRVVRHGAQRFGIDPKRVGVIGSSAGGHLALTLLTHGDDGDPMAADPIDRESSHADLGILCYPVVSMTLAQAHGGSRKNLLGDDPPEEIVNDLSAEFMPAERIVAMPPTFIWHTLEDKAVKLEPILELAMRMRQAGRTYALHVYEVGPHGLGLGSRTYDPAQFHPWVAACSRWLAAHGFTSPAAAQTPPH
jgi:acetyl esterase/lipase